MAEHEPPTEEQPAYDRWSRPQALSNRGYLLAVVVPIVIAAAGFGTVALISAGDDVRSGVSVHLPVSGWAPGSSGDSALIEGVLSVDADHCAYLAPAPGTDAPAQQWPVWPAGYHATLDHNRLSLYDEHDKVVAVAGPHVRMSGGSAPVGNYASEPCLPDTGDVPVVQSDVEVVQ